MPDAKDNHGRSNTSNMLTKPAVDIAPEPVPADLGSWSVYTAQGIMVVSVHAGVTPLHVAAIRGHLNIVNMLLDSDKSVRKASRFTMDDTGLRESNSGIC